MVDTPHCFVGDDTAAGVSQRRDPGELYERHENL
jgi:hypothetical protein